MKTSVSKETLFAFFARQATTVQKRQIDEWARDEQNRELFFRYLADWEYQQMQFVADVTEAIRLH